MRHIIAGETDPILDLPIVGIANPQVVWTLEADGTLVATLPSAKIRDLYVELPHTEPEMTYGFAKPNVGNNWSHWTAFDAVQSTSPAGLRLRLAASKLSAGTQYFAVIAHDDRQGIALPLYQKIKVVLN
jgi:hypothetical protein